MIPVTLPALLPSPDDPKDFWYSPILGPYPDSLRQDDSPVKDQAREGSCVAQALAAGLESIKIRAGEPSVDLSDQFIYYNARKRLGGLAKEGSDPRTAIHGCFKDGVPTEAVWSYLPSNANTEPPPEVWAAAAQTKLTRYSRIDMSDIADGWQPKVQLIKSALTQGHSVGIAMYVTAQIFTMIGPLEQQHYLGVCQPWPAVGGHMMKISGWLPGQYGPLILKNSWGLENHGVPYGDQGYIALGQGVLMDALEVWVLEGFAGFDPIAAQKHAWVMANPDIVRQWVRGNSATPQVIIDTAIECDLTASELGDIMGWPRLAIHDYAMGAGASLDWRGFLWT